jgi:hypothetical protein
VATLRFPTPGPSAAEQMPLRDFGMTKPHRRFTYVHPLELSRACWLRMARSPLGFVSVGLARPRYQDRTRLREPAA